MILRAPRGAIRDKEWVRAFVESLLQKHGYKKIEDFCSISTQSIIKHKGCGLIEYYKSPYGIARFAFPEHEWLPWKFGRVSSQFWDNLENLKRYLEWLSKRLGYINIEDYYRISRKDFKNNYGSGLLSLTGSSPSGIILKAYPEYDWKPWLFIKSPQGYWKEIHNRKTYLQWFEEKLGINNPEDWYKVSKRDFETNNGSGFLAYCQGSPAIAAKELYPGIEWKKEDFGLYKKRQQSLFRFIKDIFPKRIVIWEHKFADIRFKLSNAKISVDIFIPDYNLAVEYQGEQHFNSIQKWGGDNALINIQKRDKEKKEKLKQSNIELIEIDYRWDGRKESIETHFLYWIESAQIKNPPVTNEKGSLRCEEIRGLTSNWEKRFSELQKFGHCNALIIRNRSPTLATWLKNQLHAKNKGKLTLERIKRLENLGVEWLNVKTSYEWDEQYRRLESYKGKYNHTDVSQYDNEFPGLGRWVLKQRVLFNKGILTKEKTISLEKLDFCWATRDKKWDQRVQELKLFIKKYGHSNVPARWSPNPGFGRWVSTVRRAYKLKKEGICTPKRIKELSDIGFVFSLLDNKWLNDFKALQEFKKINGYCCVPRSVEYLSLNRWLYRQRQSLKNRKLTGERKNLLDSLCEK